MTEEIILVKDVVFPVFQMREDFKQSRLIKYMEDESIPASIDENGKLWSSKGPDTPKRLK